MSNSSGGQNPPKYGSGNSKPTPRNTQAQNRQRRTPVAQPTPSQTGIARHHVPTKRWNQSQASGSLVKRAVKGDVDALRQMVETFIPSDEDVLACDRIGTFGLVLRTRAFFVVTERRAASIIVGPFREFVYTDAFLEHVNSSGIGQLSRMTLYRRLLIWFVFVASVTISGSLADDSLDESLVLVILAAIVVYMLGARLIASFWHRSHKSGIFLNVRQGIHVQSFVDAQSLVTAIGIYRVFSLSRENRLSELAN